MAVHFKVVATMESDSFIMALRIMITRIGKFRSMKKDNATNFVGAENEPKRAFQ